MGTGNRGRGPANGGLPSRKFTQIAPGAYTLTGAPVRSRSARARSAAVGGPTGVPVSPPGVLREIKSFRSEYSDTYATTNGEFFAKVFPQPVNYRASDGSWQPIDDSLVSASGGFANRADSYQLQLPSSLGGGPVRLADASGSVSMRIEGGAGAAASVSGRTARYTGVLPGVDASYQASPGQVDESLTLSGPTVLPQLKVMVSLSGGLDAVENHGTVVISGGSGHRQFVLPSPIMTEAPAAGQVFPNLGQVAVSMSQVAGGVELTYTPDQAWLSAPGRRFPVTLDPSVVATASPSADCTIQTEAPTSSAFCGNGTLNYAGTSSDGAVWRTMISFQGGLGIPADAEVLGARLYMNVYATYNSPHYVVVPMSRAFVPGAASWDYYDGIDPWSLAGGDYVNTFQASGTVTTTGQTYFDITPMTQSWLDGSDAIPQLMITPDAYVPGASFATYNHASGYGPYLGIYYYPRVGSLRGATVDQTQLTDRMSLGVNVANGNLSIDNKDLHIAGNGLDESFDRVYNNLSALGNTAGGEGAGWGGGYASVPWVSAGASDAVTLTSPDGSVEVWDTDPSNPGGYIAPAGVDASLCTTSTQSGCPGLSQVPNGVMQLTMRSGERWIFGFAPSFTYFVLLADIDTNGNEITYSYNGPNGALSGLTDTHARTTSLSYSAASELSQVVDNAGGRTMSYTQNGNGQLTSYQDAAGKTTSYSYDAYGNLSQITDPAGEVTKLSYDSGGRVTSITRVTNALLGTGDTTTYAYYAPSQAYVPCTPPAGYGWYGETIKTDPNGHATAYCYDTHDRVFSTVDVYGNRTNQVYDVDDNITASQQPTGETTSTGFDTCARQTSTTAPLALPGISTSPATTTTAYPAACDANTTADWEASSATDPQHNTTSYGYNSAGDLASEQDGLASQNTIGVNYNMSNPCAGVGATCYGLITSMTDPDGHTTSYGYSSAGDLTSVTPPSPLGATTTGYDAVSRPTSVTDGKNQTTQYQYDAMDRVIKETHPDSSTTTYTYDADGNMTQMADSSTGTSNYSYDLKNRLTTESSPGVTNTYTYDGADNLISVTDAGGTVTYGYDADNRIARVQEPNVATAFSFSYDADSRRTCTSYPNGVVVQDRYDTAGELISTKAANGAGAACNLSDPNGTPSGTVFSSYVYSYANPSTLADTNLRQELQINGGNPFYFSYDPLNRLIEEQGGNLNSPSYYSYDGAGNLLVKDNADGTVSRFSYNNANQITNSSYSYDADGNLLTRPDPGGTTGLGYNSRSQTTSINPDGTGAQTLSYLGDGQKRPTQIGNAPLLGTAPTLENNQLGISSQAAAVQFLGSPSVIYYTRDPGGTLLGERTPSGDYYYVEDANGSVVALTNSTGAVANQYAYDPWGVTTFSTGTAPNSFGFDEGFQTQGGLYHFGQRYYDPNSGNWTQTDPSAANPAYDVTQADRYSFAADEPVNRTDPSGTYAACTPPERPDGRGGCLPAPPVVRSESCSHAKHRCGVWAYHQAEDACNADLGGPDLAPSPEIWGVCIGVIYAHAYKDCMSCTNACRKK